MQSLHNVPAPAKLNLFLHIRALLQACTLRVPAHHRQGGTQGGQQAELALFGAARHFESCAELLGRIFSHPQGQAALPVAYRLWVAGVDSHMAGCGAASR